MKKVIRKYIVPQKENDFRPHLLRSGGIVVLIAFIVGALLASQAQRLSLPISSYLASVLPAVLTDLANNDRTTNQLASLSLNPMLQEAATMKAYDMATKGYFAHTSPDGVTPWYWISESGYKFTYAGENLAVNFDDSDAVNTAWMNSPSHRANILNGNYTEVGIATAEGIYQGRETLFVVEMFGRPTSKPVVPKPVASNYVVTPSTVAVSNSSASSAKNESFGSGNEQVAGSEIVVSELASSSLVSGSGSQTFIAVKNTGAVPVQVSTGTVSGAEVANHSSLLDRFVTSPTRTLAVAYIVIVALLLAILIAVLLVEHDRRLRHVIIVLALIVLLCGIFYAYSAFVHSEVIVASL